MMSLPEIEQALMHECANDPRTAMLLYGILEHVRESDAALRARDERIGLLEALLVRTGMQSQNAAQNAPTKAEQDPAAELAANLARALRDAAKYGDTGLLAMISLENADEIQAEYGVEIYHEALQHIGQVLHEALDAAPAISDVDTFSCLLTRQDPEKAVLTLLDVLRSLNAAAPTLQGEQVPLQVCFGTAAYNAESTAEDLLAQAEDALICRGRRRIVAAKAAPAYRYKARIALHEAA